MKLELKHLAGYLPYNLKFICNGKINKIRWIDRFGDIDYESTNDFVNPFPPNVFNKDLDVVKLILRPLSELTKEIEVNGKKFVPCEEYEYLRFKEISRFKEGSRSLEFIQARELELLYEMHFDIYGLIKQNLAIDINTLKK